MWARAILIIGFAAATVPVVGQNWTQKSVSGPPARWGHAMAYDALHQQVVLFGGFDATGHVLGDTWVWDGTNWANATPTNSPSPRAYAAMTYDMVRGQIVLFGGGSPVQNDTWVWDGSNWTQLFPLRSPPARNRPSIGYDPLHSQVVLFGGSNGFPFNDTWTWDGTTWTRKLPSTSPAPRFWAGMGYDVVHTQMILFGGLDNSGQTYGDTWLWDGSNWGQLTPAANPAPRFGSPLAYDPLTDQLLMFSGSEMFVSRDTWSWNGTSWVQLAPSMSPAGRENHAMAFDVARGQVVLFGGLSFGPDNDTWVWGETQSGSINVTTNLSSATFTITGPANYSGSGTSFTQTSAPAGSYTLAFGNVPNYITPPSQTGTLTAGQTLTFPEAIYTPIMLTVCPTGSPTCSQSLSFTYEQGSGKGNGPQQAFVSSNGPVLNFSATVSTNPTDGPWLAVSPSGGTTPATLTISVSSNLKAGTYLGALSVSSSGATNNSQQLPVTLTVTHGPPPPPPPTEFQIFAGEHSAEPTIAADPHDSAHAVVAFNSSGPSVRMFETFDSGTKWKPVDVPFPGGFHPFSDPWLRYTVNGTLVFSVLAKTSSTVGVFVATRPGSADRFNEAVPVATVLCDSSCLKQGLTPDHPSVAVLPLFSGGSRLVVCWTNSISSDASNIKTSYSDDGLAWSPPVLVAKSSATGKELGACTVGGSSTELGILWWNSTPDSSGGDGTLNLSTSIDGATWTPVVPPLAEVGQLIAGDVFNGLRTKPYGVVLPGPAGGLRAVVQVRQDNAQVLIADSATNWKAVPLGQSNTVQFLPGGGNCSQLVGAYRLLSSTGALRYRVWSVGATDQSSPIFTSTEDMYATNGVFTGGTFYIGDYTSVDCAGNTGWAAWTDTRRGKAEIWGARFDSGIGSGLPTIAPK